MATQFLLVVSLHDGEKVEIVVFILSLDDVGKCSVGGVVERLLLVAFLLHQFVGEVDVQHSVLLYLHWDKVGHRFLARLRHTIPQLELACPVFLLLLVVLQLNSILQRELHLLAVLQLEAVVLESLRRLYVVLVGICPMELHLFPIVRHKVCGIATIHIATLRDEIALVVVAAEEIVESGKYVWQHYRRIAGSLQFLA